MPSSNKGNVAASHKSCADKANYIDIAKRVLLIEAEALEALANSLSDHFLIALDLLFSVRGHVVVSGMGKSGHIGRKIAATLASTGTPALYVHPSEASHGDLGMITKEDAVLILSNSGNTPELADVVAHANTLSIPLISITGALGSSGNPGRFLAEASDVTITLTESPEACPLGLTPTTSTTSMLALGDALAISLLHRKNFTSSDFRLLHPGGRLSRTAVVKVKDIMHSGDALPIVHKNTAMTRALIVMTEKSKGCVGVTNNKGDLIGIITDGDLRRHMNASLLEQTAAEIMSQAPRTIRPEMLAVEAISMMNDMEITVLFVTREKCPIGVVHMHDCLRAGIV